MNKNLKKGIVGTIVVAGGILFGAISDNSTLTMKEAQKIVQKGELQYDATKADIHTQRYLYVNMKKGK